MNKEQWIDEVYVLLCQSQGQPKNQNEKDNLRAWATTMAIGDESYFSNDYCPKDAHDEEMSYGG